MLRYAHTLTNFSYLFIIDLLESDSDTYYERTSPSYAPEEVSHDETYQFSPQSEDRDNFYETNDSHAEKEDGEQEAEEEDDPSYLIVQLLNTLVHKVDILSDRIVELEESNRSLKRKINKGFSVNVKPVKKRRTK